MENFHPILIISREKVYLDQEMMEGESFFVGVSRPRSVLGCFGEEFSKCNNVSCKNSIITNCGISHFVYLPLILHVTLLL